ncbi:hypothetical protein LX24_02633 [Desulfallas thermosapovorans DSM 6562]|uniref:Uncharacterized protein n=1 Tax=Desulfallas thermosapovorans DSM 6562 TaxID=1121431 RepID=A0A5S4ZP46_9FIRM|nr:hypothetical protein LX24_02633 [Desulfallas thermosapovorans DSM 6562]
MCGEKVDDRQVQAPSQIFSAGAQQVQYLWPASCLHAQVRDLQGMFPGVGI